MAPIIDRFEFAGGRIIECERPDLEVAARHAFYSSGINLQQLKRVTDAREWLIPHCESPIEVILGSFLFSVMQELAFEPFVPRLCLTSEAPSRPATEILLIPQFRWARYRVDIALRIPTTPRRLLFIECDGREFHSSDQQIARDRGRQQEMADARYPVRRFTGSEINRDPEGCADSVLVPEFARLAVEAKRSNQRAGAPSHI